MKPFKVGDKVRTRYGREARIFMVDGGGRQPIVGVVKMDSEYWEHCRWCESGIYWHSGNESPLDLVHVPETRTVECDLVLWGTGGYSVFADWADMKKAYNNPPFAVKHLTITFEEGEGL